MNKALLLLLTTSVALGASTLHLVRELRAERENAQTLQARVDALERAQPVANPFAPPPLPPPPAVDDASAPIESTPPVGQPGIAAVPVAALTHASPAMPSHEERVHMMRARAERQRALMRDPDYRDAMLSQHKAMLASTYPDLTAELQFTPEEADQFITLLANQQLRSMEDQDGPFPDGPPDAAGLAEMQRKARQRQQTNEAEMAALLGDQKLDAWREYQSTLGVRQQAAQLRNTFASKGAPLRDDQVKPLQRVLADAQQQMMQEWSRNAPRAQLAVATNVSGTFSSASVPGVATRLEAQEEHLRRQGEHNQRLRDSLTAILTSEQLKYFEEQQNAQLKLQKAHMRMMRAQAEAEERGEIAPASSNHMFYAEGVAVSSP